MGKCVISTKTKEEMEAVENKNNFVVKMFHSHQCPHCKQMLPVIEQKCNEIKSISPDDNLVAFAECEVGSKYCKEKAVELGAKGIPFIVGVPKGQKPVFTVEGARPNELTENVEMLKKVINQSKAAAASVGNPGPPPERRPTYTYVPPPMPPVQDGPRFGNEQVRMGYGGRESVVPLCTPGATCSQEDYNARMARFIARKNSVRADAPGNLSDQI